MRTGVIARKMGMTQLYNEFGFHVPVTVLRIEDLEVVSVKKVEIEGYNAVQLGFGEKKAKNVSKSMKGYYAKSSVEPKQLLKEFRVSEDSLLSVGDKPSSEHFVSGQYVDVVGTSKGKGFAGAMKRHNFRGLEASHGVSISHRSHGSTGQCQDPGKVFKGKKMAGQLGNKRITVQNLEVISSDSDRGLIYIKGAVPGSKNQTVFVSDAIKKALPSSAVIPAKLCQNLAEVESSREGEVV